MHGFRLCASSRRGAKKFTQEINQGRRARIVIDISGLRKILRPRNRLNPRYGPSSFVTSSVCIRPFGRRIKSYELISLVQQNMWTFLHNFDDILHLADCRVHET
jgi:hypothetical protein